MRRNLLEAALRLKRYEELVVRDQLKEWREENAETLGFIYNLISPGTPQAEDDS